MMNDSQQQPSTSAVEPDFMALHRTGVRMVFFALFLFGVTGIARLLLDSWLQPLPLETAVERWSVLALQCAACAIYLVLTAGLWKRLSRKPAK